MFVLEYFDEEICQWEPIEEYAQRGPAIDAYVKKRCAIDSDAQRSYRETKIRLRRSNRRNSIANNG